MFNTIPKDNVRKYSLQWIISFELLIVNKRKSFEVNVIKNYVC